MGLSTTDITDFGIPVFVIAVVFAIGGFWLFFIRPLIKKGNPLFRDERYALKLIITVIFIFIASIIAVIGYNWYIDIIEKESFCKAVLRSLKQNEMNENSLNELKFLLKSLDRKLSVEESQLLKKIHKAENLEQFANDLDLKEMNESLIALLESKTFIRILTKYESFLSPTSDRARIIYETRNILGYADAIAVGSVGVFLPILILLWNNARQTISETLYRLISYRANKDRLNINQDDLEKSINSVHSDLKELQQIGTDLRPFFWGTIIVGFVFLVSLALSNFTKWVDLNSYVLVVAQKVFAIILFLWLLTFLSMYQILVQPLFREFKHLHLFGLKNL